MSEDLDEIAKKALLDVQSQIMNDGKIMPIKWDAATGKPIMAYIPDEYIERFKVQGAICEIPLKLPSLNEYINACRKNAYVGAKLKKQTQEDIMWFVKKLPKFEKPINIHFHWVEGNRKRDYDNIASAKKFILDAMVKCGKLKDDNRNYVTGFSDTFGYEKNTWKVILEIEECEDES